VPIIEATPAREQRLSAAHITTDAIRGVVAPEPAIRASGARTLEARRPGLALAAIAVANLDGGTPCVPFGANRGDEPRTDPQPT
jgi:hypothetical protein